MIRSASSRCNLKVVSSENDIKRIISAASNDGHYVVAPTHFVENANGEVISYFSCGIIPVMHFWMNSKENAFTSRRVIQACIETGDNYLRQRRLPYGFIACADSSPFHKYMERHFGFQYTQSTDLFVHFVK